MAEVKEKHPTWFKMKIERRQLIKQLPPNGCECVACLLGFQRNRRNPRNLDAYRKNCFLRILPGYGRGVAAI